MSANLYELRGVERRYLKGSAEVRAVHDLDLDIEPGEFVSLQGPSGSGKSTLLQLLGGLDTPTAGTVVFDGKDLSRAKDRTLTDIRSQRIGFIFQQFNLIPTLSALDNVAIAIPPSTMSKRQRHERSADLLGGVGLGPRLRHLPSRLSGGEQQRVAIARALANHPEVIVADEPTGNLDSENAGELMLLLARMRAERKVTIVVATHDPEVSRYAERHIRMRDGAIVDQASS
jgi:putative ABC transport system ATP-binding protein